MCVYMCMYIYTYIHTHRLSIKSFPDYKHSLQENYVEYKHISLLLLKLVSKILCHVGLCFKKKFLLHICIYMFVCVCGLCIEVGRERKREGGGERGGR
jgi:hypothetical protein